MPAPARCSRGGWCGWKRHPRKHPRSAPPLANSSRHGMPRAGRYRHKPWKARPSGKPWAPTKPQPWSRPHWPPLPIRPRHERPGTTHSHSRRRLRHAGHPDPARVGHAHAAHRRSGGGGRRPVPRGQPPAVRATGPPHGSRRPPRTALRPAGHGRQSRRTRAIRKHRPHVAAAVEAMLRAAPVRHAVLWGLCDGASASLLYMQATQDPRMTGPALLNPWVRSEAGPPARGSSTTTASASWSRTSGASWQAAA